MIIKELTKSQFRDEFGTNDGFSYDGLGALYDYINDYIDNYLDDHNTKLDVIALRCEYTEYDTIKDYNNDYNEEYTDYKDITATAVVGIDKDRFIIANY
jgi:hypothetical protein